MIVERKEEKLAALARGTDQSVSRFLSPIKLRVVTHAEAAIQQDAETDRLLFIRKEFDFLRNAVIEHRKIPGLQGGDVAALRIRHTYANGDEIDADLERVLSAKK